MKTISTYIFVYFIVILFILLSCNKGVEDNWIAMVDDIQITEYEFTVRFNFNPYLAQIHNEKEAKKIILSTLIAEKLLALESSNSSRISGDIKTRIDQHKKEVMIEQFRRDSVENQIYVSDAELWKEYQKAVKEVHIQYVAFSALGEASIIKKDIDNGSTYEKAVQNYMNKQGWQNEAIPEKTIKWNSESYDLEEKIFALKSGEVSNPIKINGDYYLIKIKEIRNTQYPNNTDFTNRLPALKDRILKKKIEEKYREFYDQYIANRSGIVDWKGLDNVFELITKDVKFNQNTTQTHPFSDDKGLSNEVYLNYETRQSQLKNIVVIKFPDGSTWNMGELMKALKYGPFAFNYKNKSTFKRSFKHNVLLVLEYEAIYQLAKKAGYNKNEQVLMDTKIWETYYRANDYRFQKLKQAVSDIYMNDSTQFVSDGRFTSRQQFRLDFFDDYLSMLSKKYSISINQDKYANIELNKTDIVVMKTHFANRLIAPLTQPITRLPQWSNIINSILKKSGIT